jgi:uncharacterized protein (DUF362 family)
MEEGVDMSVNGKSFISRRNFLKSSAAGLAVFPAAGMGYRSPDGPVRNTNVVLVKTGDRKQGVSQALKLLDLTGANNKRVVVKPNFNTADDAPGSTHNDTLSQLMYELHERGARDITLGESSGPPNTGGVMEEKGIFDLARDSEFGIVNFDEMPESDWVHFPSAGTHWPEGYYLPRHAVNAEYLVSTCCLKTHGYGGVFTMSLKLAVGLTPKMINGTAPRRTMHRSPDMRRMIAELNGGYKPQLIVLDGVDAFVDGGPSNGALRKANVIIAGTDRVAVDAVGVAVLKELGSNEAIMGRKIFEQEQIQRAAELGLGVSSTAEIELVTPDAASRQYAADLRPILAQG